MRRSCGAHLESCAGLVTPGGRGGLVIRVNFTADKTQCERVIVGDLSRSGARSEVKGRQDSNSVWVSALYTSSYRPMYSRK